ncbi:mechanosensitive ion channel family protein [Methanoregula sp.]|uniref:mechanosensitive ion channel family protein n=1 Tax=Methanoregula sp. TaxID=2052170 RepID=UPI0026234DAC|nr:mechanosensitive ion channel family protein [Methanoregula sp.]MDD5142681.1 mechanosensitive ion channel family protein [Methanoregula sp.]
MVLLSTVVYGNVTVSDLLVFSIIVAVSVIIARIVGVYIKKGLADKVKADELVKIVRLAQAAIILAGIFVSLPSFHVDFGELLLIGGTAGIIIGFASQRLVTNVGSGVFLLFERPVKIGDTVSIGTTTGTIEDIRILSTTLKTFEGIYIRIPNETVFNSEITNYVANQARRFEYRITIRHSDDARKAIRIIEGLLAAHPFVLHNPPPSVFVDELGENGVNIMVRIWAPSREWWSVRIAMLSKIKDTLAQEGFTVPFPQRTVWLQDRPAPAPAPKDGKGV